MKKASSSCCSLMWDKESAGMIIIRHENLTRKWEMRPKMIHHPEFVLPLLLPSRWPLLLLFCLNFRLLNQPFSLKLLHGWHDNLSRCSVSQIEGWKLQFTNLKEFIFLPLISFFYKTSLFIKGHSSHMRTQSQIHVRPVFCWLMSDKIFRFVLDEFFILEFFYTDQIIKGCFGTFLHVRLVCTPKCTPIEHVKYVNAFLGCNPWWLEDASQIQPKYTCGNLHTWVYSPFLEAFRGR